MKRKRINFVRLFITIFIIYACFTLVNQQLKIREAEKKNDQLSLQIDEIKQENERAKALLDNASSPEYLEKAAREQLGMVKPGEIIYIDQGSKADATDNSETTVKASNEDSASNENSPTKPAADGTISGTNSGTDSGTGTDNTTVEKGGNQQ